MLSLADALTSLREHFGFDDFREGQREVIGAILEGKDAVVVMPTGSGKSTTLYSALKRINIPDKKIITIEDPV